MNEQLILTTGLVRDDEGMHAERLKLWEEFNTCWLSALEKQREMSLQMLDTGQRPHPPSTLMESDQMENMGKELVRLCDIMEKHGLVDYQMGVWEEEIITRKSLVLQICEHLSDYLVLNTCLDLLEEQGDIARPNVASSSSVNPRRR